jgi:hypothetical protein
LTAISRVSEAVELLDEEKPDEVMDPELLDVVRHARDVLTEWWQEDRVTDPAPSDAKTKNRKPLPDAFRSAAYDLTKAVERLSRLVEDDRFARNAEQVARVCRHDLLRASDLLATVVERVPSLTQEGN